MLKPEDIDSLVHTALIEASPGDLVVIINKAYSEENKEEPEEDWNEDILEMMFGGNEVGMSGGGGSGTSQYESHVPFAANMAPFGF